jgi:hypothetical protein
MWRQSMQTKAMAPSWQRVAAGINVSTRKRVKEALCHFLFIHYRPSRCTRANSILAASATGPPRAVRRSTEIVPLPPECAAGPKAPWDFRPAEMFSYFGRSGRRCHRRGCIGALMSRIWHCQNP